MKNLLLALLFTVLLIGCNKKQDPPLSVTPTKSNTAANTYWVNSSSSVIHRKSCIWYGHTRSGFYTDSCQGKTCGICGGCK
ncbi:hypothetical protein BH10BAC5_BH10BAC5_16880 [soil metagenome]